VGALPLRARVGFPLEHHRPAWHRSDPIGIQEGDAPSPPGPRRLGDGGGQRMPLRAR